MPPKRPKLLSSSRPPAKVSSVTPTSTANLSSKRTRSVIRAHHTLQKQLAQAQAANDETALRELQGKLEENGGLRMYQKASTVGQGRERGGDTSWVLVGWLREDGVLPKTPLRGVSGREDVEGGMRECETLRILEVGALSTQNALNIEGMTRVRRVDLHSQYPEIEEVDFMQLKHEEEWEGEIGYNILSLSLVVNFVGDPRARGEMLRHTVGFLRHNGTKVDEEVKQGDRGKEFLAALFLVLPLPCVDNSRYLTEERLTSMMESLGYGKTKVKRSGKLYYSLWRLEHPSRGEGKRGTTRPAQKRAGTEQGATARPFKKEELRKGKDRNNFCIVLGDAG